MMKRELEPLVEVLDWKLTHWITGYAKTYLTNTLLSGGIGSLIAGVPLHNHCLLIFGIFLIASATIELYIVDKYGEQKKKEELEAIDERLKYTNDRIDEYLLNKYDDRAEEFLKHLEENEDG